jgi:outer membrane cobalamin receptor
MVPAASSLSILIPHTVSTTFAIGAPPIFKLESARQTGHAYMSFSRSFKAPTLDQLFDQRPIPIPTRPFSVTVSNPDLRPQHGSSVEAGVIHRAAIGAASASFPHPRCGG